MKNNVIAFSCAVKAPKNRNLIAYYIEKIIRENSDYHHRLTNQKIAELLLSQYGIKTGRRSVSEYVFALQDSGIGIILTSSGSYYTSARSANWISEYFDWSASNS